jgi:predicted nucleic acid-binding protein
LRLALDSNILAYAEGVNGEAMQQKALDLLARLDPEQTILPAQTLGELFNVLVRKAHWARGAARAAIMTWQDTYPVTETSSRVISAAADLASDHGLAIWDAVVVAAAASARCRLLLSEDMHEGFTWNGITVTNPFTDTRHPLLAALLKAA